LATATAGSSDERLLFVLPSATGASALPWAHFAVTIKWVSDDTEQSWRRIGEEPLATWQEVSLDSLEAARRLLVERHLRSSVSRSYYAAYSAITGELTRIGVRFPRGWHNPSHEQVIALIRNGLKLSQAARWQINRAIRRLRHARQDADYRPDVSVGLDLARSCVRDAALILRTLEITDD
jgi:uncharacterized protein (UPF0332 family)